MSTSTKPTSSEIFGYLFRLRRWVPRVDEMWSQCLQQASQKWKRRSTMEKHAVRLILNNLMNEGDSRTDNLNKRVRAFSDHIHEILKRSKADYDNLLSGEVLTADDVALQQAIKNEDYHNVFVGTPSNNVKKDEYYEQAAKKVDSLIDKYHLQALQEMNAAAPKTKAKKRWNQQDIQQQIDQHIAEVVPNKEAYKEAKQKQATNLAEFLADV